MTQSELDKPLWVEKEGVRFFYSERADPTLTQMVKVDADPPITDAEIALFNRATEYGDNLRRFAIVSGPSKNAPEGVVCLTQVEPVTRESTEVLVDIFLACRQRLTTPTEAEALELLGHEEAEVRRYARKEYFVWMSRWTKEDFERDQALDLGVDPQGL